MDEVLNQTRAILTSTAQRWTNLTQSLSADLLTRPPAPGEWSALECLQHMLDVESLMLFRLGVFLEGEPQQVKDIPAFDPDQHGTRLPPGLPPAELAAEFAARRQRSLERLQTLTPADLDRPARHQKLGPVTLREMLHTWAAHDLNHTVQAERALMQPFLQGCGPWVQYFAAHVVSG